MGWSRILRCHVFSSVVENVPKMLLLVCRPSLCMLELLQIVWLMAYSYSIFVGVVG
jgi:hypothetical protein